MASRFWVGGSGNWDGSDTSHWAATSGGASGASVPTGSDDVTFDSNSGTSATVTITGATALANTITINKSDLTLLHSAGSTVTGAVTLTTGTLNTNGQTCSWGSFVSANTNVRTLTMGASAITLTSNGQSWNTSTYTNLTVTANTSTVTLTGSAPTWFGGSGFNTNGGSITLSGSGMAVVANSFTCANLTRTGTANKTDALQFNGGSTVITGTLTVNGNSSINRVQVQSLANGTTCNVTAAAVSLSNADFRDINALGAASPFTGTSIGNCGGNTGITFDTPATQTWQGTSGGNWSDVSKWTSRVPLPQDDVVINAAFTASQTITIDMPRIGSNISWTGVSGNPTWSQNIASGSYVFGSWTGSSGTTRGSWSGGIFFAGRGSHTITTGSNANNMPGTTFTAPGGTYTLQDSYNTGGGGLTLTEGTLTTNNQPLTTTSFTGTGSNSRTLNLGSSTVTLTGASGNIFTTSTWTNFTFNTGTSTIVISDTGASTKTLIVTGSTATFYNVQITGGGSGAVNFNFGALQKTFNTITIGAPKNVIFGSSSTTAVSNFVANGSAGNIISITASTPGTPATITKTSGLVSCDYLSIQDSAATGGAAWYAGANSTNVSGNSGWIFTAPGYAGWFNIL